MVIDGTVSESWVSDSKEEEEEFETGTETPGVTRGEWREHPRCRCGSQQGGAWRGTRMDGSFALGRTGLRTRVGPINHRRRQDEHSALCLEVQMHRFGRPFSGPCSVMKFVPRNRAPVMPRLSPKMKALLTRLRTGFGCFFLDLGVRKWILAGRLGESEENLVE